MSTPQARPTSIRIFLADGVPDGLQRRGVTLYVINARRYYQWRVCFRWTDAGAEDVEIVDYH